MTSLYGHEVPNEGTHINLTHGYWWYMGKTERFFLQDHTNEVVLLPRCFPSFKQLHRCQYDFRCIVAKMFSVFQAVVPLPRWASSKSNNTLTMQLCVQLLAATVGCRATHSTRHLTHLCPPLRSTFAVRETASLGIMGEPRVPPLNPPETIVL